MGLGIVSDEEFNSTLEGPQHRSPVKPAYKDMPVPGRNEGDNNVPDSVRKIIGETAILEGRKEALALGRVLDVSPSSVSAYSAGANSTSSYEKKPLIPHLNKVKERISRKARSMVIKAIDSIDEAKLKRADAGELAQVARTMNAIFKDMEPDDNEGGLKGNSGPTFVFMVPPIREEEKYPVITVRD